MPLSRNQIEKYADILIWGLETARTKPYKEYDPILVRWDLASQPLAEALYRKLLEKRSNVSLQTLPSPSMEEAFYSIGDKKQRVWIREGTRAFYEKLAGSVFLNAPTSLTHLKNIDPKRIAEVAKARKPLRRILEKREQRGQFGWTLCSFPTRELAKQARISLEAYTKQIIRACLLNSSDPVGRWNEIFKHSIEIKRWLNALPMKAVRVETRTMSLEMSIGEKRKFIGISGHNIPSFEIFTSPDWRGSVGTYYADQPSFHNGNLVKGIQLTFKKGRVSEAKASRGGKYLRQMLEMDRGASQIGEFSLTDRRFSRIDTFMADTLFDENFGGKNGNCHIALGNSYADTFSGNPATLSKEKKKALGFNDSALHWDMVNTEPKMVTAVLRSGKEQVIYEKGQFQI